MKEIKSKLIKASVEYVESRIGRFNETMRELEEALKPESRSCMGDKYETSRAMLHLEFEKVSGQMEQFNTLRKTASLIDKQPVLSKVGFGSVVKTTTSNYFIAIPAGEIKVEEESFYVVGVNSPVARELMGKEEGDAFNINGKTSTIKKIF
ncbi:transcription elongation factor [Antarcticibacterium flavum]|uniref:Transcription elongation factor n=1 Tax=Antarcticibacterium flavum TaxID=2058175 RepID=A0A5B7X308_9FLAO|nr:MULTISPECIES: GreA/GreB family elongation factor [Antarcticibacterium]MCM4160127.1 transcription elongation factor [Antarcticibacterium sp. W02-3]QCY69680.1 transcription elongation factor [Antarcticibacterium flavum]